MFALNSGWVVPYVTLGLGFMMYRVSGEEIKGGSDLDGFTFNYGAGMVVSLCETIELDILIVVIPCLGRVRIKGQNKKGINYLNRILKAMQHWAYI